MKAMQWTIAQLMTASVLLVLAAIHVYWAVGGTAGSNTVIPTRDGQPLFRPSRMTTLAVAILLSCVAEVIFNGHRLGSWLLAALFAARAVGEFRYVGFFKRVTGTPFAIWDTRLFSPLCVVIAAGCVAVAQGW